jgi:hypothetical protein
MKGPMATRRRENRGTPSPREIVAASASSGARRPGARLAAIGELEGSGVLFFNQQVHALSL